MAHGFRPCLRCRPEAAPGSPAAEGVHATVRRAVQLIEDGALATGSIEDLAARLGIGARHLRRIFKEHTGVTPQDHAKARRLLRARQLIVDSNLSMTEIAEVAGYGSLRRFNDAMKTLTAMPRPPFVAACDRPGAPRPTASSGTGDNRSAGAAQ
jgi:AraC family transcriptional regulator, regulatory protein of adaptative response / DNA-3-methyladenine glycosylase II